MNLVTSRVASETMPASRVSRRTSAASAALGSRLTKRDRQLVALIFDESARRHAKSVQVKMSPSGVVTTSVYLQWPAQQDIENAQVSTHGVPAPACTRSAPGAAPPARTEVATTSASQEQDITDVGVHRFMVHEPGKLLPTPKGKAATRPAGKKVDKNALSATGSAPKKPPPKPQPSPPPAPARKLPSHVPAPPPTGANALGREGKQRGEAKRKGERSGSDSPPYKSPRGSDVEDESDMSEDEPDTGDLFGGHWDSDYG
jgi:hypothetical protein